VRGGIRTTTDLKQRTMKRSHVIITGTGRTGTTFLVQLFTRLGYDTGYGDSVQSTIANTKSKGGLEHNLLKDGCPFIVKDPRFCNYADVAIARSDIKIEHILLPVRNIEAATASRIHNKGSSSGGLWLTANDAGAAEQEDVLLRLLSKLLVSLAKTDIPVTLLHYPTLVKNSWYLYDKLRPLLGVMDYETFKIVFGHTAQEDWVHQYNDDDK